MLFLYFSFLATSWPQLRFVMIVSTVHIVSTLYSEHLHIVNNFGETLQWWFIGIVSLYSEPLHIVNKILLQIGEKVFTFSYCSSLIICVT